MFSGEDKTTHCAPHLGILLIARSCMVAVPMYFSVSKGIARFLDHYLFCGDKPLVSTILQICQSLDLFYAY